MKYKVPKKAEIHSLALPVLQLPAHQWKRGVDRGPPVCAYLRHPSYSWVAVNIWIS